MSIKIVWLLAGVAMAAAAARAEPAAPASELERVLERVAERFRGAPAVEGRFVQSYTNRVLGRTIEEQGTLLLAPPRRVRWAYDEPDSKLFVSAGRWAWFYVPEDGVAYRLRLDEERAQLLPSRFIAGGLRLADEFSLSELESSDGERRLRLDPLTPSEEFEHLELELKEGEEPELSALTVVDMLGNRTVYRFSGLKPTGPVPDELFEFVPPPGVEVVGDS